MAKTPDGKKVLNTHISKEEHSFLKNMAEKNAMTITMYLRELIRVEMGKINQGQIITGSKVNNTFK